MAQKKATINYIYRVKDNSKKPIGVLDSGVGGITVWAEIVRMLPGQSTVYMADTANCPYGPRSHEQIRELTDRCAKKLLEQDVKLIVVACNTMTAAAIKMLREKYPSVPFVGMEPAIKPAFAATHSGVIGVLATNATLVGPLYNHTLDQFAGEAKVIEVAGEGLVEMVETSRQDSPECIQLLKFYIDPMIRQGADTLVLGCTHYPFLRESINLISGGSLQIIDPARAVARRVKQLLEQNDMLAAENSAPEYNFISTASDKASLELKERAKNYIFTLQNKD